MEDEKYIQIGVTALRDPATGDYLPAVPLYIKAGNEVAAAQERMISNIGGVLAKKFKEYLDAIGEEGAIA